MNDLDIFTLLIQKIQTGLISVKGSDLQKIIAREARIIKVRKTAVTLARPLTQDDHRTGLASPQRAGEILIPGYILTLEKPAAFSVGDMLCKGVKNELWPMDKNEFELIKSYAGYDQDGWGVYLNTNTSWAMQMDEVFCTIIHDGSLQEGIAGGYLLFNEKSQWPNHPDVFRDSYTPVSC